jgi:hypothetical protein
VALPRLSPVTLLDPPPAAIICVDRSERLLGPVGLLDVRGSRTSIAPAQTELALLPWTDLRIGKGLSNEATWLSLDDGDRRPSEHKASRAILPRPGDLKDAQLELGHDADQDQ